MGKIIKESILDYAENNFSGIIPHPSLITLLCIKGGVKFDEAEEKSPKASHLTLTRALKFLVEDEEVERIVKRKMAEAVTVPREPAPSTEQQEKEGHIEERGGGRFDAYSEQPVLPPLQKKQHLPLL